MPTDAPYTPPRKQPNVLWWIGGVFLLLVGLFLFQLFGPNPPIVVSKPTTCITEPLDPNGLPDYQQYILDKLRSGVTPENNAAVLMWQALGPGETKREDRALILSELGLVGAVTNDDVLVPLYGRANRERLRRWFDENVPGWRPTSVENPAALAQFGMTQEQLDEEELIDRALEAPWRSEQLPPLADWVRSNQAPIELLVAASQRPRFYYPSVSLLKGSEDGLIGMDLSGIQQARDVARALSVRAMWHLGEGRHDAAWQDVAAIYRWSQLVGQGDTLVEQLVAIAISGVAGQRTVEILHDAGLPPALAREIQRDLAAIPPPSQMARSFDDMERIAYLDIVVRLHAAGLADLVAYVADASGDDAFPPLNYVLVDWNVVLAKGNSIYDRMAAALRMPDHQSRRQAIDKMEMEVQTLADELREPGNWIGGLFSPARRSDMAAAAVVSLMVPAMSACDDAEERARAERSLVELAAALAVFRVEQGEYPESLDALVPGVVAELPVDLYQSKPFVYFRIDDGFLLYSTGENGTDDGGSNARYSVFEGRSMSELDESQGESMEAKIPAGADDISIRVPRPAFELPEVPTVD